MKRPKSILITGATGFLGSHLAETLVERGYELTAIHRKDNIPEHLQDIGIKWEKAELFDLYKLSELLTDKETIVHAAGMVSYSDRAMPKLKKVNVEATADLVNLALENGVENFVHISTIAALNGNKEGEPIAEDDFGKDFKELTYYGQSKMLGEKEVWRGAAEGLNAVVVNPSVIIGHSDWSNSSPRLFKQIYKGWDYYTEGSTGYVGVEDVVEMTIDLFEGKHFNQRFILSAENLNFRDFFALMAKHLNKKAPSKQASKTQAKWLARLDNLRQRISGSKPLLTRQLVKSLFNQSAYDNSLVRKTLGREFESIDSAIERTAKVFLESQAKNQSSEG